MRGSFFILSLMFAVASTCPVSGQETPSAEADTAEATDWQADEPIDVTLPIVSELPEDMKLFGEVVEGDDKLTRKFEKLGKKTEGRAEALEEFKRDVLTAASAQKAWKDALWKAFGITAKNVVIDPPSMDEVKGQVAAELTQRLEAKYPPSLRSKLEAQAIMRYPTVKIGDQTTVRLRSGRQVTGRVNSLGDIEANVGGVDIPILDLDSRFHLEKQSRNRRLFLQQNYVDKRRAYRLALRKKLPPYLLAKNGYVRYEGKWVPAKALAERIDARIAHLAHRGEEAKVERKLKFDNLKGLAIKIGVGVGALLFVVLVLAVALRKKK